MRTGLLVLTLVLVACGTGEESGAERPPVIPTAISGSIDLDNAESLTAYAARSHTWPVAYEARFQADGSFQIDLTGAPSNLLPSCGGYEDSQVVATVFTSDEPLTFKHDGELQQDAELQTVWYAQRRGTDNLGDYIMAWVYFAQTTTLFLDDGAVNCDELGSPVSFPAGWVTMREREGGPYGRYYTLDSVGGSWETRSVEW